MTRARNYLNLSQSLVKGVTRGASALAALALPTVFLLGSLGANDVSWAEDSVMSTPATTDSRPPAQGSPVALVEQHNCWTDAALVDMVGVVPGHVVVTLPNGTPVYGGERMVGKALGQIFNGEDHGLTVAGFCR